MRGQRIADRECAIAGPEAEYALDSIHSNSTHNRKPGEPDITEWIDDLTAGCGAQDSPISEK